MAEHQNEKEGASLVKTAAQDPSISDFRKASRSFKTLAKGVDVTDTDDVCAAIMYDVLAGKVDIQQAAIMLKGVDCMLKKEDQVIKREEMALHLELQQERRARMKARGTARRAALVP